MSTLMISLTFCSTCDSPKQSNVIEVSYETPLPSGRYVSSANSSWQGKDSQPPVSISAEKLRSELTPEPIVVTIPGQTVDGSATRLITGSVPTRILTCSEYASHPSSVVVRVKIWPPKLLKVCSNSLVLLSITPSKSHWKLVFSDKSGDACSDNVSPVHRLKYLWIYPVAGCASSVSLFEVLTMRGEISTQPSWALIDRENKIVKKSNKYLFLFLNLLLFKGKNNTNFLIVNNSFSNILLYFFNGRI